MLILSEYSLLTHFSTTRLRMRLETRFRTPCLLSPTPNHRPTVSPYWNPMAPSPAQWGPHSSKPSPGQNSVSHQQTIPIYLPLLIPTQLEILFFRLV